MNNPRDLKDPGAGSEAGRMNILVKKLELEGVPEAFTGEAMGLTLFPVLFALAERVIRLENQMAELEGGK